jgi:hypothetical protein
MICPDHQILFQNYQIKEDEVDRDVAGVMEKRDACRVLVRKLEGKRPPGRPRHS